MNKGNGFSLKLLCVVSAVSALACFSVSLIFGAISGNEEGFYNGGVFCGTFTVFISLLSLEQNRKKRYYVYLMNKENKTMDASVFNELIGKTVKVRTIDEFMSGEVISVSGDFVKIEKKSKNGSDFFYINVNAVQRIIVKNVIK